MGGTNMNLVQALEALDKNKKIMVKIGETEEIFYKDREGKIKNDNGFIFIPDFSKEYKIYDERKEKIWSSIKEKRLTFFLFLFIRKVRFCR